MNIISLTSNAIFRQEDSTTVNGIEINLIDTNYLTFSKTQSAYKFINAEATHTLIHEMGHAMAAKLLNLEEISVTIDLNTSCGLTVYQEIENNPLNKNVIAAAGPIFHVGLIAFTLNTLRQISTKYPLIATTFAIGQVAALYKECKYWAKSSKKQDNGDAGLIAKSNMYHWLAATTILSGCALSACSSASQIFASSFATIASYLI